MLPTPMISDFDRFCAHSPLNFLVLPESSGDFQLAGVVDV